MSKKGILIVVSGFAGTGKGTIIKELLRKHDNYAVSVSATTRNPRAGEKEGTSYFFKTEQEFEEMIKQNRFLEYAKYVNHYYGTPRDYVEEQLDKGNDVILEIEIQGALSVKENSVRLFRFFYFPPVRRN